ncbi:GNAT family N-acetyltransferase [Geopsychrobacter electrodiphilus]|uniref:GNAT family N-acetyltransferase n=1 Tax=Geopsychrobacter electrodiphilus TaxID=225196 RepID=UPI00035D8E9F|nr:GNAT family N-acetyltransferase [Geopsychrobacter electrodiphilus]
MEYEFLNNPGAQRFETIISGHMVHINYNRDDDVLTLVHTEVPAVLGGQGLGSKIVQFALDYAKSRGLQIVPRCPFVRSYIDRHPDYQDLVP